MALSVFFFLLVLVFLLVLLKKRKLATYSLAALLLLFLFVAQGWLPSLLLSQWQQGEPLQKISWEAENVIILLGSGSYKWSASEQMNTPPLGMSRVREAARLYYMCKETGNSCQIIPTGGDPVGKGVSEAQIMKRELMEISVNEEDILMEDKSFNTFQNALFTARLINVDETKNIILVTSGYHLKRALLYFSYFGIDAQGSPADQTQAKLSLLPVSYNLLALDIFVHELLGVLRFHIYNWLGLNPKVEKP